MFSTTINRVENNTKYFWRYQRYTFIQEYFEKPVVPASPIIVISYLGLIIRYAYFLFISRRGEVKDIPIGKYGLSGIFS